MIKKAALFFHLIDEDDKLNLADLAFVIILTKIAFSTTIDWAAMVVLATTCLNSMHQRHVDAKFDQNTLVQEQTAALKDLQQKVAPILDTVRSKLT